MPESSQQQQQRGKSPQDLCAILGEQLDTLLSNCGGTVTVNTIKAVCEIIRAYSTLWDHMPERAQRAEMVRPVYVLKKPRVPA